MYGQRTERFVGCGGTCCTPEASGLPQPRQNADSSGICLPHAWQYMGNIIRLRWAFCTIMGHNGSAYASSGAGLLPEPCPKPNGTPGLRLGARRRSKIAQ